MKIIKTKKDLIDSIKSLKEESKNIAPTIDKEILFIPTMGALHDGHISLVKAARKSTDIVIVSIFVNPTQFKEGEDFGLYPKTEEEDCTKLKEAKVDIVFIPEINEIYSDGVVKDNIKLKYANILEGEFREGFFYGVTTVINKLFDVVKPNKAFFGEKDYQQLQIIKQIVDIRKDNIEIISVPTKREKDGLAFSSRNIYLSYNERKIAPFLYKSLRNAKKMYEESYDISDIEEKTKKYLIEKGFDSIDYISIRDISLNKNITEEIRILAAAHLGKTRLIDNL